mmetsp:Transcript_16656/g.41733  ORF Transcript_16656/g.41733 Transcript_16656/m.41733 type:complete len:443 (-) Transcript_16656:1378-2706(-)
MTRRMVTRLLTSGRSTSRRRGRRRITASSRSNGRLVAASTSTRSHSEVFSPSQLDMNSFLILRIASCSPVLSRRPSMLSTSSTKTTLGAILCARVKRARTYFSPSPNHLLASVDMDTLIKLAPLSEATALASMVLPVPGGPKSSTPRVGLVSDPRAKSSGRCSGSITTSRSVFFTASSAPMLSKLTPTSSAGMTSPSTRFSNSLSVCTSFRDTLCLGSPAALPGAASSCAVFSSATAFPSAPPRTTSLLSLSSAPAAPASAELISWLETAKPSSFSTASGDSACSDISTLFISSSGISTSHRAASCRTARWLAAPCMETMSRSMAFFHCAASGSPVGGYNTMRLGISFPSIFIILGCSVRDGLRSSARRGSRKDRSSSAEAGEPPGPAAPMRAKMPPQVRSFLASLMCCPTSSSRPLAFSARRLKCRKRSTWPITDFSTSLR